MYSDKREVRRLMFLVIGTVGILAVISWAITFYLVTTAFAAPPDEVAVDFATATMVDGVSPTPNPSPFNCPTCKDTGWIMHGDGHQTKCPNCDLANLPGGFLDVVRQAKDLIRKGNELADRGKAILDAVQREGKLTVDIRLPKISADCPDGKCSTAVFVPQVSATQYQGTSSKLSCPDGKCSISSYRRSQTKPKPKTRWRWKR